jgi:hypothetical protein
VRSRCLHPGQQQGRRWPSSNSSWVRRMRRSRVTSCLASSTQQMNSLRAKGVMSLQAASAVEFAISAWRRSAGSLCTTPPGTGWLLTGASVTRLSELLTEALATWEDAVYPRPFSCWIKQTPREHELAAPRNLECWGLHAHSHMLGRPRNRRGTFVFGCLQARTRSYRRRYGSSCRGREGELCPPRMEECMGTRVAVRAMTLRQLDVPVSQWRRQDISEVRNVLTDLGADPELARGCRGSVVLSFAEVPESHPYLNPAVAAFLQDLYSEFPYLLYFLNPDPACGALDGFFASVGALSEDQAGVWIVWSDDVGTAFYAALAAAAEFAIKQGDDWVAVVEGYEYHESQTRYSEIREILITRGVIQA